MRKIPKFLKTLPEVYGLGIHELAVLLVVLHFSMVFNLNSLVSIALAGICMAAMKVVRRNFDFVGFLLPRKKEIFVTDVRRGNDSAL